MGKWDSVLDAILEKQLGLSGAVHKDDMVSKMMEYYGLTKDNAENIVKTWTEENWE